MGTFAAFVMGLVSALHVIGSGYGGPRSILNLARGVKAMAINLVFALAHPLVAGPANYPQAREVCAIGSEVMSKGSKIALFSRLRGRFGFC